MFSLDSNTVPNVRKFVNHLQFLLSFCKQSGFVHHFCHRSDFLSTGETLGTWTFKTPNLYFTQIL